MWTSCRFECSTTFVPPGKTRARLINGLRGRHMASATLPTYRARSSTPCPLRRTEPRDTSSTKAGAYRGTRCMRNCVERSIGHQSKPAVVRVIFNRELCTRHEHERRLLWRAADRLAKAVVIDMYGQLLLYMHTRRVL